VVYYNCVRCMTPPFRLSRKEGGHLVSATPPKQPIGFLWNFTQL
jgi:hypothetical protein